MALIHDLWDEFGRLTAPQKRVVFEMFWNGYTEEETAETMGITARAVRATLARAEKNLRNSLTACSGFGRSEALVHMKAEKQGAERGNGQRPDKHKAPASNGPPASACPPPDIYLGSPARDAFIKELSWCAASPFLQLQNRGGYNRRARENRERIARDQAAEREERRALQAA
jgi:predicted DNA-binding protein YlxM (UPF0122 family)